MVLSINQPHHSSSTCCVVLEDFQRQYAPWLARRGFEGKTITVSVLDYNSLWSDGSLGCGSVQLTPEVVTSRVPFTVELLKDGKRTGTTVDIDVRFVSFNGKLATFVREVLGLLG